MEILPYLNEQCFLEENSYHCVTCECSQCMDTQVNNTQKSGESYLLLFTPVATS